MKADYTNCQKLLLNQLIIKLVRYITPIEFKSFSNKFIKLKEFDPHDSIQSIIKKIDDNLEMYFLNYYVF